MGQDKMNKEICIIKINENIRAVETDQPLTLPLRELKHDCRFMQFYNDFYDIKNEDRIKEEIKAKKKEYQQRPEVKAHIKEIKHQYYLKKKLQQTK